jgi:hypothetical protein
MPDQIYIGKFAKGLKTNPLPFNLDNDAFPTMFNFYTWRGRAKRKRGTLFLGQLQLQMQSFLSPNPNMLWQLPVINFFNGIANLFSFLSGLVGVNQKLLSPTSIFISNITQSAQAVVTIVPVAGSIAYVIGEVVQITLVLGMTQINNGYYTIVNVVGNNITLNINSTLFSPYTPGTGVISLVNGATIVPGSLNIGYNSQIFTEPSIPNGTLIGSGGATGTINYVTGTIVLSNTVFGNFAGGGKFSYFPGLPVMGLEDFSSSVTSSLYPILLAFDTKYSYQCNQSATNAIFYNVSYYKGTNSPVIWSGADYQQFWTTNYPSTTTNFSGSLWATNNKPGFHYVIGTYVSGSGTNIVQFIFTSNGNPFTTLVLNDQLFFNEWLTSTTINGITGFVSTVVNATTGTYNVTFPGNETISGTGIAQLLTNSLPGQDGIRWYDGDPTAGTGFPTGTGLGWVNFAPPLTATSVSIDDTPTGLYYLVGALAILPFKDRLLFFSPYISTSTLNGGTGVVIQLQDTVLWSWNGTPYYAPPVPLNQTFNIKAYFVDQTGLGGYLPAGISQPIITVSNNEDVLLIGFGGDGRKTRFVYTGNDLQPFLFFNINSELPSSSTFSAVPLDKGVIDIGQYGISLTDQQSSQRIDLDIPDSVFEIQNLNNGVLRVNAIRDFFKEWIYFAYPVDDSAVDPTTGIQWRFPTQTFQFNYRDNTWGILYENFTHHGYFRAKNKKTWATLKFHQWTQWREPWNSGATSAMFTQVIAGNPQGYVLIKGQGTGEAISGTISAIMNNGGNTQITSFNHCVTDDNNNSGPDYLYFQNAQTLLTSVITFITPGIQTIITTVNTFIAGQFVTISNVVGMTQFNGNTYQIISATPTSITLGVDSTLFTPYISSGNVTSAFNGLIGRVIMIIDVNNFVVDIPFPSITYIGLGVFTRLSLPLIQTRQFPFYWDQGRQVRLSVQKYLMDYTADSQVTVNIYLSQDPDDAYNNPNINVPPNSLIYSQIMFTCPESINIGLTPPNTNLQMPTAQGQFQIWHRLNTSLQGDSVQIGITLSDAQMKNLTFATSEITLHGIQLTVSPGPQLC